jgi:hypothetical protein
MIAVAAATMTGCQAVESGPLQWGGDEVTVCMPVTKGNQTVAGDVIAAPDDSSVEITSVDLAESEGTKIVGSYILPIIDMTTIGVSKYPPVSSVAWGERQDAVGFVLQPGVDMNLVVVLERTGSDPGEVLSFTAGYTMAGKNFVNAGTTHYVLDDDCS